MRIRFRTPLIRDLVELYLAGHDVDAATRRKLRSQLTHATVAFGERRVESLSTAELRAWRLSLPERSRADIFRAFKQVLAQFAADAGRTSPAAGVRNGKPKPPEFVPFNTWEELERLGECLGPAYSALPAFAAGTGLRPEEWAALERRDLDREAGVVSVERVYSQGVLKPCSKSRLQQRLVPLRARVLAALSQHPARIDTPLLFPAPRGGYLDLDTFRRRLWTPAVRAAGYTEPRRLYDLRHTYAAWSIAAGVGLFQLSRRMGTSLQMIDLTYGHLTLDAVESERALLDLYDEAVGS